jgi:hypothetical protein
MNKYKIQDIDDYRNRLTEKQKQSLLKHCNRYNVNPNICAWYDDLEDFFSDWCDDLGYKKMEARQLLKKNNNQGEFHIFDNGEIVRLVK